MFLIGLNHENKTHISGSEILKYIIIKPIIGRLCSSIVRSRPPPAISHSLLILAVLVEVLV